MKKTLLTIAIVLLAIAAQAQIKLHNDGQISLASLTKNYGLQVMANGKTFFRSQEYNEYSWVEMSKSNAEKQKHWIVQNQYDQNSGSHNFYVYGSGVAHGYGFITFANNNSSRDEAEPINGERAINIINNINGYYYKIPSTVTPEEIEGNEYVEDAAVQHMIADLEKSTVGLSPQDLDEYFPEAVRTDPSNRLGIDYQSVVTMLVEAVKQQQREIEELRNALEKSGLNK